MASAQLLLSATAGDLLTTYIHVSVDLSYPVTKAVQNFTKKDLCRTDPYRAIRLTKICSRLPKSETLREQAGDLVQYRRLMQKFNLNLSKLTPWQWVPEISHDR